MIAWDVSLIEPQTYIVNIQSGDERITQGFKAASDTDARAKLDELLALDTHRMGRRAVVTLTRLDGSPVFSQRS